eukprot:817566-Pyramimonas_sp.AAC.1
MTSVRDQSLLRWSWPPARKPGASLVVVPGGLNEGAAGGVAIRRGAQSPAVAPPPKLSWAATQSKPRILFHKWLQRARDKPGHSQKPHLCQWYQ